ncbi:MAG: lysophospholipid acyltransferase family protein [Gemmatimonadetes bacterium]|nr:lysophospholipid acyltransferase family protein [Gemmatimonadota bacterium]
MTWYVPVVGDQVPQRGNARTRALGRWALRLIGWTIEGEIPNIPKFMIIVAPHTSNWDFPVGVAVKFALGIRATFLGKHTLFRWPLGVVMRWLGGVPVFRHAPRNVVEQTVDHLNHAERVVIVLSPEGTRKKLPAWRTGFHYVARGAQLPILPAALDFSTKTVRFYPLYHPTDSVETNLAELGRHFKASMACHPEQY